MREALPIWLVLIVAALALFTLMRATIPECRVGKPVWVYSTWICDANRR